MEQITTTEDLRAWRSELRASGKTVAVVPTMGNLHSGHLSLLEKAQSVADHVICSIFVNPAQFGPEEDIANYPRTLAKDLQALRELSIDTVFTPSVAAMYPEGDQTRITVPDISAHHCGKSRPRHFSGVATVVCKFLNLVQADYAIFGEKDFQQLAVIRRMVTDLFIPTEVLGAPTRRADDGLALSSRNGYLTTSERALSPMLYQQLRAVKAALEVSSQQDWRTLETEAQQVLATSGWQPDYFNIVRQNDLETAHPGDEVLVILAAARLGKARLIDNVQVHLNR
ncbi:MAG: pantoate--beta-alanine ligase [Natronospirillum sp.]